jgi:hypothetical protein
MTKPKYETSHMKILIFADVFIWGKYENKVYQWTLSAKEYRLKVDKRVNVKISGNLNRHVRKIVSRVSDRRRGIGLTIGFIGSRYNYSYSVSQCTPFTTVQ